MNRLPLSIAIAVATVHLSAAAGAAGPGCPASSANFFQTSAFSVEVAEKGKAKPPSKPKDLAPSWRLELGGGVLIFRYRAGGLRLVGAGGGRACFAY